MHHTGILLMPLAESYELQVSSTRLTITQVKLADLEKAMPREDLERKATKEDQRSFRCGSRSKDHGLCGQGGLD